MPSCFVFLLALPSFCCLPRTVLIFSRHALPCCLLAMCSSILSCAILFRIIVCLLKQLSSRRLRQTYRLVLKQLLGMRLAVCDDIQRAWAEAVACFEIRFQWRRATCWGAAACSRVQIQRPDRLESIDTKFAIDACSSACGVLTRWRSSA
jgi:hypothetical protein